MVKIRYLNQGSSFTCRNTEGQYFDLAAKEDVGTTHPWKQDQALRAWVQV